jgi:hypothetical protein
MEQLFCQYERWRGRILMYEYTEKDIIRFWSKVKKSSTDNNNCWIWIGALNEKGYGRFKLGRKMIKAHRFIMSVYNSFPTPDIQVLHTCDNPSCVNPSHLFFGTNNDNMQDKKYKGRGTIGEKNPGAKLTERDIISIRQDGRSKQELADAYDISVGAIDNIIKRRRWKHIP